MFRMAQPVRRLVVCRVRAMLQAFQTTHAMDRAERVTIRAVFQKLISDLPGIPVSIDQPAKQNPTLPDRVRSKREIVKSYDRGRDRTCDPLRYRGQPVRAVSCKADALTTGPRSLL